MFPHGLFKALVATLCCIIPLQANAEFDYDGDGLADIVFRNPQLKQFTSPDNNFAVNFGGRLPDIPVSGDFDNDGIADIAFRRPSNATWYILNSSGSNYGSSRNDGIQRHRFGSKASDIPIIGDFDGDGISDLAVRRSSNKTWYIKNSSGSNFNSDRQDGIQRIRFGSWDEDIPVVADFNGDGITDIAVRRPSNHYWYIKNSPGSAEDYNAPRGDGIQRIRFGTRSGDIPVPADYDGDGIADVAVRRPSNFHWYILSSKTGDIIRIKFGQREGDIPMVADYDGDGKADVAVRRPSTRFTYVRRSSDNEIMRFQTGQPEDIPVAAPVHLIMELLSKQMDSDDDGLSDYDETNLYHTAPYNADTDGDGLNDGEEVNQYQTNPNNTDSDNDGISDGDEVAQGSDPNDASSLPISSIDVSGTKGALYPGPQVQEGLMAFYENVYEFAEDGTGILHDSSLVDHHTWHFSWQQITDDKIELDINSGVTSPFYDVYPFDNIGEKWGRQYAEQLVLAADNGLIGDFVEFPYTSGITHQTWHLQQQDQHKIITEVVGTLTETLLIPEDITAGLPGGWQGEAQPTLQTVQEPLLYEYYYNPPELLEGVSSADLQGKWIIPFYYQLNVSFLDEDESTSYYHDLLDLDDATASSMVSGQQFDWSLQNSSIVLENDDETFIVTPIIQNEFQYFATIERQLSGVTQSIFAAQITQQKTDETPLTEWAITELPHIYASGIWAWRKTDFDGDQLRADKLTGYQFQPDGAAKVQLRKTHNQDPALDSFNWYDWRYQILDDHIRIYYQWEHDILARYWYPMGTLGNGHTVIFEYFTGTFDSDFDGDFEDEQTEYFTVPQNNNVVKVDLSDYPETWNNTDFDSDGLSSAVEGEIGTDPYNPDTDGDGYSDGDEVLYGLDPLIPEVMADLDLIQDPNLAACIRNGMPEGDFAVAFIHRLECPGTDVETLAGMEQFTDLTYLNLEENPRLTDISSIAGLTKMENINLANTAAKDLSALANMNELHYVELSGIGLTDTDIIALGTKPGLYELRLSHNQLTSTNTLLGVIQAPELYLLHLDNNQISDVSGHAQAPALGDLNLSNNLIENITPLYSATDLYLLSIRSNPGIACLDLVWLNAHLLGTLIYQDECTIDGDSDGDGLTDTEETSVYFTDPFNADSDSDGLGDGAEILVHGTDPNNSDSDGDGFSDYKEIVAGTDPNQPDLNFADEALENCVRDNVDPRHSSFLSIWRLDCSGYNIQSLEGIEILTRLRNLNLKNTQVSDLSPLAGYETFEFLMLENTPVSDLSPLTTVSVNELYISGSQVSELSALSDGAALSHLDISNTPVSDLSPLSGQTNLRLLNFSRTDVPDITSLSNLKKLRVLRFSHTQVTNLTPITELTELVELDISYTDLTNIDALSETNGLVNFYMMSTGIDNLAALSGQEGLRSFAASGSPISDIEPLLNSKLLTNLYINDTLVTDISILREFSQLQRLSIAGLPLDNMSVLSDHSNISYLDISHTQIADLSPIEASLFTLYSLHMGYTPVTDISILDSVLWLAELDISGTNKEFITTAKNIGQLIYLGLEDIPLEPADISFLQDKTTLRHIKLSRTGLSDLDEVLELLPTIFLREIWFNGNQINDLDGIEAFASLAYLQLNDNQLEDLEPLFGLPQLERLQITNNPTLQCSEIEGLQEALPTLEVVSDACGSDAKRQDPSRDAMAGDSWLEPRQYNLFELH